MFCDLPRYNPLNCCIRTANLTNNGIPEMKGDNKVIKALNGCLKDQLTVINQTFLHARMAKDWGLEEFNEREYEYSIQSMKDADKLIERILFLEGLPNLQNLGKLLIGEKIPEIVDGDISMYTAMHKTTSAAIKLCEDSKDYISRDVLNELLEHIEEAIDWYETQQWLMENTGMENYLQSQAGDD